CAGSSERARAASEFQLGRQKTSKGEQGVYQRRCGSSGAQRTEAIGVRTAAGSDQLHYRARRETYITARGAKRLRDELQKLRAANANSQQVTQSEQILASVYVVDPSNLKQAQIKFLTFRCSRKISRSIAVRLR